MANQDQQPKKKNHQMQQEVTTQQQTNVGTKIGQGVVLGLSVALLSGFLLAGLLAKFSQPLTNQEEQQAQQQSTSLQAIDGGGEMFLTQPLYVRPAQQNPAFVGHGDDYYAQQYTDNVSVSSKNYVDRSCSVAGGGDAYEYSIERNGHPSGLVECRFNSAELAAPDKSETSSIEFIVNATDCPGCSHLLPLGTTVELTSINNWVSGWSEDDNCVMDTFGEECGSMGYTVKAEFNGEQLLTYRIHVFNHSSTKPLTIVFEVRIQKFLVEENYCDDGTQYGECSWQQPLYCDPFRHGLIAACEICGCPSETPICCGQSGQGGGYCAATSCGNGGGGSPSLLKAPQYLLDAMDDYCREHPNDPLCEAMGY